MQKRSFDLSCKYHSHVSISESGLFCLASKQEKSKLQVNMTVIAAIGFPDEVILLSDSRASYSKNVLPPKDKLKKIYQLSQYIAFAYTTSDVNLLSKVIEKITVFAQNISQNVPTEERLKLITHKATEVYEEVCKERNSRATSVIVYAAMVDKPYKIERNKYKLLEKNCGTLPFAPEKIKGISANQKSKFVKIPSPTPLLVKQRFPGGETMATIGWDFTAEGSGKDFVAEIEKYYPKILGMGSGFNRAILLQDLCEHYIQFAKNETLGGLIQIFVIDKTGVHPVIYELKGPKGSIRKYINGNGDWVEEDDKGTLLRNAQQKL